ncbi:unnamed protein product [Caenorhabditis sp. 36 PRJEB53466]|nr:unnamed protein product [Caenorhabditis sp. 36 PRJEB53466]
MCFGEETIVALEKVMEERKRKLRLERKSKRTFLARRIKRCRRFPNFVHQCVIKKKRAAMHKLGFIKVARISESQNYSGYEEEEDEFYIPEEMRSMTPAQRIEYLLEWNSMQGLAAYKKRIAEHENTNSPQAPTQLDELHFCTQLCVILY